MIPKSRVLPYYGSTLCLIGNRKKRRSQVPHVIFLLFLVNASILEEIVYRQLLLEKLTFPFVQVVVTSFLFVLSHGPNQLGSWLMYSCLGLTLAVVRLKTDCMTVIALHLLWNSLAYVVTFL